MMSLLYSRPSVESHLALSKNLYSPYKSYLGPRRSASHPQSQISDLPLYPHPATPVLPSSLSSDVPSRCVHLLFSLIYSCLSHMKAVLSFPSDQKCQQWRLSASLVSNSSSLIAGIPFPHHLAFLSYSHIWVLFCIGLPSPLCQWSSPFPRTSPFCFVSPVSLSLEFALSFSPHPPPGYAPGSFATPTSFCFTSNATSSSLAR